MKRLLTHYGLAIAAIACLAAVEPSAILAADEPMAVGQSSEKIIVKGKVSDSQGEPIIGANVAVAGAKGTGTTTDIDGLFTMSVPAGAQLEISYVGCQTLTVEAQPDMDITLQDQVNALDEMVVVGFGTQKKVNLTGAVGTASGKELASRPVSSATQALQGMIPGLKITTSSGQLDNDMSISIRGNGTISSGSSGSPLVLIDGMEGDINTVNPNDIESISVLKDAAASSIYGSRAPFGVILITTKRGEEGRTSISYSNNFSWSSPMKLPKSMDSYSFAVYMNEALDNSNLAHQFSDETLQKMLDFQAGKLTGGLDVSSSNPDAWEDEWSLGYANTDIYDELFRNNVFSTEHNVSVSGGNAKTNFFTSINYRHQGGMLKIGDDGKNRYNVNLKVNSQVLPWLSWNAGVRFTRTDMWRPKALNDNFYSSFGRQNWPNIPMYDPNGNMLGCNALDLEQGGKRKTTTDQHYYQGAIIIEPVKNWRTHVEFNYGVTDYFVKETGLVAYYTGPTGLLTASYTQSNDYLYEASNKEDYLNLNVYSEYSGTIAGKNNFKLMAGFQTEDMRQRNLGVTKNGLIMRGDMPEFDLTNGLLTNGNQQDATVTGNSNRWDNAGFFGRLNYDYDSRYLIEGNLRYDGTSRFRQGKRWQWSPSVSVGWNIAQEAFMEGVRGTLNQLKLRGSYGQLGNMNTSSWYPTYRTMSISSFNGSWLQEGARPSTSTVGSLISESLTWETIRTWDVGLDFALFNSRLTGSADYFVRYTKNMVGPAPELPSTLGISAPSTNNCDLHTNGWEFSITWRDRLACGLSYSITANISDQDTYIDSYPSNTTGSLSSYNKGRHLNEIWGFETIGIAKTQEEMDAHLATADQSAIGSQWSAGDIMYRDVSGDGKITKGSQTLDDHGDLVYLGDADPHYFFGLDLNAQYKGFDLRVFFQGVLQHKVWPSDGYFWGCNGSQNIWHMRGFVQHQDYFRDEPIGLEGYEIGVNLDSYFPRPVLSSASGYKNQEVQSRYLQDASYCRLKNLQIGYSLPQGVLSKLGLSACRLYVSGENLLTFTKLFDLFDPETIGSTGANTYPLSRTWSFGLNVSF